MNHPDMLIERLTQERDEARAALAAAESAARAAGEERDAMRKALERVSEFLDREDFGASEVTSMWLEIEKVLRHSPVVGGPGGAERSGA